MLDSVIKAFSPNQFIRLFLQRQEMNDFILEVEVGKDERRDMCMSKLIKLYTSNMSSYFMSIIYQKKKQKTKQLWCNVCVRMWETEREDFVQKALFQDKYDATWAGGEK